MNSSMVIQSQLLATKFFIPVTSGNLIPRSRLTAWLAESLKHPLTLVSAPAGFGKTMLLSTWAQSLPAGNPLVAWISLDEEDNDPRLFWTYVLSALDQQQPERFTPLLKHLQSPEAPSLMYVLTALINRVLESAEHLVLILDDYHLISEQQVHTTLSYLIEHLPSQLHIILATRVDPPLSLSHLRGRQQMLEVRTEQLRCTVEETRTFFKEAIGIQLPEQMIQEVTARTEGWLVGLRLLGLSLPAQANPAALLREVSGDQRYILDYLIQEVLGRQPQEVQTFLLSTCILQRLNASLCDAVTGQTGSLQMLEQLERANLFVASLDSKRQWYCYHALFAEALYYQLMQTHADLVPGLHYRASLWYAQHDQTTEAILHALKSCEWLWAADLIERKSLALNALSWGVSHYQLFLLRDWLEQIPADVMHSRPRLCLARIWMLMFITPQTVLETWLNEVEATLTHALTQDSQKQSLPSMLVPQSRQELEHLLGKAITYRALLLSHQKDGAAALPLCERAQALLSADNFGVRAHLAVARLFATYASSINNAEAAIQIGLQASSLNQATGNTAQAISIMGLTAMHMIGTGRLHESQRLAQQAILLDKKPRAFVSPAAGWPTVWQAEILREWNQLGAALSSVEEAIKLMTQLEWTPVLTYLLHGYSILLRVSLSRGDYDVAYSALQKIERMGMNMHLDMYVYACSHFTIVDRVRLWLARGELDQATRWTEELDLKERHGTPFAREREEVACARVFLARKLPKIALQRLEDVLQRAATGQRWGHVIEIRLLQALTYQMLQQETQALNALSEAVRLAEPGGYIRSFVDEGASMEALLSRLRAEHSKDRSTSYLDTVLAAFLRQNKAQKRQPKRTRQERLS